MSAFPTSQPFRVGNHLESHRRVSPAPVCHSAWPRSAPGQTALRGCSEPRLAAARARKHSSSGRQSARCPQSRALLPPGTAGRDTLFMLEDHAACDHQMHLRRLQTEPSRCPDQLQQSFARADLTHRAYQEESWETPNAPASASYFHPSKEPAQIHSVINSGYVPLNENGPRNALAVAWKQLRRAWDVAAEWRYESSREG